MKSDVMDGASLGTWDGIERRKAWNCQNCVVLSGEHNARAERKAGTSQVLEVLGTVAGVCLGVAVFYATGLAESDAGWFRNLLGFATVFWMVSMVRLGLSGD